MVHITYLTKLSPSRIIPNPTRTFFKICQFLNVLGTSALQTPLYSQQILATFFFQHKFFVFFCSNTNFWFDNRIYKHIQWGSGMQCLKKILLDDEELKYTLNYFTSFKLYFNSNIFLGFLDFNKRNI